MPAFIITAVVGIVLIVIGISIIKGNINLIHSYHRKRVSKEDKPIFGKLMGTGMIICGVCIFLSSLLSIVGEILDQHMLIIIASYITIIGLTTGFTIMVYATIKYNKGIF